MDRQKLTETLQNSLSFWDKLTDNQKRMMTEQTRPVHYIKGESVRSRLENCAGMILVRSGELRVYIVSDDGREVTLYRLEPGEVCVLSAGCVLAAINFEVLIDAVEDSDILLVSPAVFRQLTEENIYVKCFGYETSAARFSDVMWSMQQILFFSADRRLAVFLSGEYEKNGCMVKMTQDQIARYIGSAREVVSRMLKYFEQEKLVRLFRGGLEILDPDGLEKLAGNEE
ncbi:MAG: Crp/Fnr family transcriptional regulator [Eubacteriaceae bacterium]|jgi:CRP/FNR family transcriptional regulator